MENTDALPQTIADRKTIVLKARLDLNAAKKLGEDKKVDLFVSFGFIKPHSTDISLTVINKFYEPLIIIGGKYSIDYCKKHFFELKTDNEVQKFFVGGKELKFETLNCGEPSRVLKIMGEEHVHHENETYFVLDRLMRELSPQEVHLAPFETSENQENSLNDLRKPTITLDEEIEFLRSRLVKKPPNVEEVIQEIFEINERMIVYSPIYELVFQNVKNSKTVTAMIDGVTGKITVVRLDAVSEKQKVPAIGLPKILPKRELVPFQENTIDHTINDSLNSSEIKTDLKPNFAIQQEKSSEQSSKPELKTEVEVAIALATDSLRRLGFTSEMHLLKCSLEGELYVLELGLQNKIAKMWVNTKTKEIKEYEIQESASA